MDLSFVACFGLFCASCKDSPEEKISYEEISETDSEAAIQKAFIDSSDGVPEAEIPKGLERFFKLLGKASRSSEALDTERFLSIDGMLAALASSGALDGLTSGQERGFNSGFRSASAQLGASLKQMSYDDFKISLVEKIDEDQRLVYTKLYDNEINVVTQIRWWMVLTEDGWRSYDFEDLSVGLRTVKLMGTLIKSGVGANPAPWAKDFLGVVRSMQTLDMTDPDALIGMEGTVKKLAGYDLPDDVERFTSMFVTSILVMKGESEAALAELDAAEKRGNVAPLFQYQKGGALAQLGRHEEALECYEAHIKKLGSDSDTLELVSDSYWALGKMEEAKESAIEGLADNPNSSGCLASLLIASSPEEVGSDAMNDRVDGSKSGEDAVEFALDAVLGEDTPLATAIFEVLKKNFPNNESLEYYEDELGEEE